QLRPDRGTQVPQGLDPDLAVGVHLGTTPDLAEVAVRVTTGAGARTPRTHARRCAHGTVDRLGTDKVGSATDVIADADLTRRGGVRLESLIQEEVQGVPVAPRLAHRAGLYVAERRVTERVDHEPVGQSVRVLVVDHVRLVPAVGGEERVGR